MLAIFQKFEVYFIVAATVLLFGIGYHYGAKDVQEAWNKDKLEQQQAIDQAKDAKIAQDKAAGNINTNIGGNYENSIPAIGNDYAVLRDGLFKLPAPDGRDTIGFSRSTDGVNLEAIAGAGASQHQKDTGRITELKRKLVDIGQEHDELLQTVVLWRSWYAQQLTNSQAAH